MSIQLLWALMLGGGLLFLPESPRYWVKKGSLDRAASNLAKLRGQPVDSEYVQAELAEIVANNEYEMSVIPQSGYWSSWANCFKGSLRNPASNLRRTILGTSMQMMQQWTGISECFEFLFPRIMLIWYRLYLLLRYHLLPATRHDQQPLSHLAHHHSCQRLLNAPIFLRD